MRRKTHPTSQGPDDRADARQTAGTGQQLGQLQSADTVQAARPARLWTAGELADHLQVSTGWVYDRTRQNGPEVIPHLKLGKYVRFDPASSKFQAWLKAQGVADKSPGCSGAD